MDENCINCDKVFEKKKKGFKRKSIDSNLPNSYRSILESTFEEPVAPGKHLFICDTCAASCVKAEKYTSALKDFKSAKSNTSYLGKRSYRPSTSTLTKSESTGSCMPCSPIKKRQNTSTLNFNRSSYKSFIKKATSYIKDGKYYTAFRILLKSSKAAKTAFVKLVAQTVQQEIKAAKHHLIPFSENFSQQSINEFNWEKTLTTIELQLPVLSTAVKSALAPRKAFSKLDFDHKPGPLVPAYGFLLSSMLYHRLPSKIKFLQEVLSVEMYRSGCNQKLFKWLNKLGLCRSVTSTRAVIDRICQDFDLEIKRWKNNIQNDLGNFDQDDQTIYHDVTDTSEISTADDNISDIDNAEDNGSTSSDDHNVVESGDDDVEGIVPLLESSTIAENDVLVNSVNAELDPGYSLCWDNVQKLCVSRHHSLNQNKMMLWALCFATRNRISFRHLDYDMDTCAAINIPLEEYLPSNDDWDLLRQRMEIITQRILKKNFTTFSDSDVECHIPHQYSAQSSLKSEIVNLGVVKENPSTCKGVIEILKHLHQYVPSTANGEPYQLISHGDQLSVERSIDAKLAMAGSEDTFDKLLGLIPRPQGFHKRNIILQDAMNKFYCTKSAADKGSLFQIRNKFEHRNVKKKVNDCVNSCVDLWNFTTEGYVCLLACKILGISSLTECPEDLVDKDIKSISAKIMGIIWPDGKRAHLLDLDKTIEYTECDDTFAYEEDDETEERPLLELSSDGEDQHEAVTEPAIPSEDHIFQHSCALLFTGLKLMADKDAERENDGPAMISIWRINMIDFFNNNHNKYLILGHRILSAVNGWLPARLREEIIWNSTANLTALPGGNLALDLVNEFQNNEFKTNLKNSHGQYSDNQVARCSRITGSLGKSVEEVFQHNIIDRHISSSKSSTFSDNINMSKFIHTYLKENLFQKMKGRKFKGLENLMNNICLKKPADLQKRLTKYSIQLDKERYLCEK